MGGYVSRAFISGGDFVQSHLTERRSTGAMTDGYCVELIKTRIAEVAREKAELVERLNIMNGLIELTADVKTKALRKIAWMEEKDRSVTRLNQVLPCPAILRGCTRPAAGCGDLRLAATHLALFLADGVGSPRNSRREGGRPRDGVGDGAWRPQRRIL